MALTEEQKKIFLEHLTKRVKQVSCPICSETNWGIDGITAPLFWNEETKDGAGSLMSKAYPLAMLVCSGCFYVNHFAWLPIKRESEQEVADGE